MTTQINRAVTVTIPNPTAEQMIASAALLDAANSETETPPTKKTKRGKPETTVSDDEEESFGKKAMKKEDLDESENDDEDTDGDESDDEDEGLSFDEVKAAINKWGNKKPDDMKAILLGFNLKSTKELEKHKKYWEPVYRKVMAKLKKK